MVRPPGYDTFCGGQRQQEPSGGYRSYPQPQRFRRTFFENPAWLLVGFDLLKEHAGYKRDDLLPRLRESGVLERKMATRRYGGHCWAAGDGGEICDSETADRDMLGKGGRWKPELGYLHPVLTRPGGPCSGCRPRQRDLGIEKEISPPVRATAAGPFCRIERGGGNRSWIEILIRDNFSRFSAPSLFLRGGPWG